MIDHLKILIAAQERVVRRNILVCMDALERADRGLAGKTILNNLGELQAAGPMLDASIAKLCAYRQILAEMETHK